MYQIAIREIELPWADLGMPGVTMKVLHKDEATGAMAVYAAIFAPGVLECVRKIGSRSKARSWWMPRSSATADAVSQDGSTATGR